MMSFKCKECGAEFGSRRSLHAHIKKHKMMIADYYVKHYQRRDKLTGALLPFKKVDDYFRVDFSHPGNFDKWLKVAPKNEARDYIQSLLKRRIDEKDLNYGPCDLELRSVGLPSVDVYKEFFGSYTAACNACGVEPLLAGRLPKAFWENYSKETILVDTREKRPLTFTNSEPMKLDVGDYSVLPEKFDYTFVDRKSLPDLCASVSNFKERFQREMQRCRDIGCYLFVVIEADYETIHLKNRSLFHKHNLGYIKSEIRYFQREFHDCCQFIFAGNRGYSTVLIPKLLCLGRQLHKVDVQYFWNQMLERKKQNVGSR